MEFEFEKDRSRWMEMARKADPHYRIRISRELEEPVLTFADSFFSILSEIIPNCFFEVCEIDHFLKYLEPDPFPDWHYVSTRSYLCRSDAERAYLFCLRDGFLWLRQGEGDQFTVIAQEHFRSILMDYRSALLDLCVEKARPEDFRNLDWSFRVWQHPCREELDDLQVRFAESDRWLAAHPDEDPDDRPLALAEWFCAWFYAEHLSGMPGSCPVTPEEGFFREYRWEEGWPDDRNLRVLIRDGMVCLQALNIYRRSSCAIPLSVFRSVLKKIPEALTEHRLRRRSDAIYGNWEYTISRVGNEVLVEFQDKAVADMDGFHFIRVGNQSPLVKINYVSYLMKQLCQYAYTEAILRRLETAESYGTCTGDYGSDIFARLMKDGWVVFGEDLSGYACGRRTARCLPENVFRDILIDVAAEKDPRFHHLRQSAFYQGIWREDGSRKRKVPPTKPRWQQTGKMWPLP